MRDSSLLIIVFVTLIFGQACLAQPTNFQAQVRARFILPCTGSSNYNPNLANACQLDPSGQQTAYFSGGVSIAWGTGEISPSLRSNLTFTSFPSVTLGLGLGNARAIGRLSHQNYPINCFSSCSQFIPTSFKLGFFVNVALEGATLFRPFEGTFNLFLDETPNQDARSVLNGPCTISGVNQEISWVNAGGYTPDFPCCPYFTTKQTPPDPISRGGPCSDRITFTSVTAPATFELGGTIYTLAIAGFSTSSTTFNNQITFFTSQENQLQEAFVYAYVLRQCANNAACDDGIQCTTDVCDANGLCRNTPVALGTACTDLANSSPRYDPTNQCMAWRCDGAGQCRGSSINQGSTCTNPGTQPSGTTSDCISARCNSGVCSWQRAPDGTTCTTLNTNQQNAITSDPTCNRAACRNGGCTFFPQNSGSCTSITTSLCNKRVCKTFTANSFTKGTCRGTFMSQGSCTTIDTRECNNRVCVAQNGLGVCGYSPRNGGSCAGLAPVQCNRRTCSNGVCVYRTNTNEAPTSCPNLAAVGSCTKYVCKGFSRNPPGSCSIQAKTGSCKSLSPRECNNRACTAGVCTYVQGQWTTGSCQQLPIQECKGRRCVSRNTGSSSSPVNSIGTCGYSNIEGSCTSLAVRECKVRRCNSGVCRHTDTTGGSCTSLAPSVCNRRICQTSAGGGTALCRYQFFSSDPTAGTCGLAPAVCNNRGCRDNNGVGSCGYSAASGSCTGSPLPAARECKARTCVSKAGVSPRRGSCSYVNAFPGSTCTADLGPINACTRKICVSGVCTRAVLEGRPACTPGFSTNDPSCIPSRCVSSATSGGTCSTSFRTGGSCTVILTRTCSARRCTSSGTCAYSFLSSNTGCNDASAGPVGSFCQPQFCNGRGTCVNNRALREGASCIFRSNEVTQACVTSACTAGTCLDTSAATNTTLICRANSPNEDSCQRYYCAYRAATNRFDKRGTCVRQVNPSTIDAQCSIINNADSERDQRCYTLQCTAGACTKIFKPAGTFCDTPPNTPTLNGYGCSQFVCDGSGNCDTSKTVAVRNGSLCAGVVPCDPAEPGCLGECQRFVCFNGRCQADYYNENNNCTYIKFLTAREDGSMEVRAENPDPTQSNQCTLGRCYQGRCKAYFVQNGTACGNRSLNNDLCYGDYCNEQGRCIVTNRKDCQGIIPLPSVCWDVTCDARDGSCVLVSSGRIDCSCIDDCSACTGVFSLTNSTADRTLGCYWCTPGNDDQVFSDANSGTPQPSCFNRFLPGNLTEIPAPPGWTCYTDDSICGGDDDLTGGAIAGIVLGILGLTSFALLMIAVAILLFRYFAAASVPPANASLTDLAFDSNVKNNVFYEGANLDQISALYSDPHFITN